MKQLRILKAAAKQSMSKHEWKLLNNDHAMMAYSELDSDTETGNAVEEKLKHEAKDSFMGQGSDCSSFYSVDLS